MLCMILLWLVLFCYGIFCFRVCFVYVIMLSYAWCRVQSRIGSLERIVFTVYNHEQVTLSALVSKLILLHCRFTANSTVTIVLCCALICFHLI